MDGSLSLLTLHTTRYDPCAAERSIVLPESDDLVQVHAKLIIVLTRGGSTARLVAKYRPSIPVLTVAVPVLTIDNLEWKCSGETPARQCLVMRGLVPLLAEGSGRASDTDTTDDILASAIEYAKMQNYLTGGDTVVALHRIGNASVIKLIDVK
jgi:pyruvate kinase